MKYIKYSLMSLIITYILLLVTDMFVTKSFLKSNLFEGEYNVWNDIKDSNIDEDLIIIGSSRTYVQINPMIFKQKLNLNTYNLGFNGQTIELIKYRNDILLQKNIHPKNAVINLDIIALTQGKDIYDKEQLIPMLLYDKKVYSFIKKSLELNLLDLYIPLIRYRKFEYKDVNMLKEIYKVYFYSNYKKHKRYKGFRGINYPWTDVNTVKYKINVKSSKLKNLEDMILDLKKINTNVILINSPEYITQINNQENRNDILNLYYNIAKKYNIPFINYSKDSINYKKELFYNPNHLNFKGANIFTKKLVKDLKFYLKQ